MMFRMFYNIQEIIQGGINCYLVRYIVKDKFKFLLSIFKVYLTWLPCKFNIFVYATWLNTFVPVESNKFSLLCCLKQFSVKTPTIDTIYVQPDDIT